MNKNLKMQEKMKLEIQVISMETLKPSSPTPSHLKTFTLSFLDQVFPPFHMPFLLFYPTDTPHDDNITKILKSSLIHTLTQFYPLAGRFIDDSTMSCNDEGVPFIETCVNSRLTDFLTMSPKLELLHELLPPKELPSLGPRPISELTPLAFQVNVFACGGVVIGCYMLHKVLDTASLGTFFKYWAGLVRNRDQDVNVVGPNFDVIVNAFPPRPTVEPVFAPDRVNSPPKNVPSFVVLVRSFKITNDAITSLKAMAASGAVSGPTSFEVVAGFVWKTIMAAASMASESTPMDTILSVSMNMRPRTNPPLPKESMGNCTTIVQAKGTKLGTLKELVGEIHEAILKAKPKIEKFQGENGIEEICFDIKETSRIIMDENSCVYHLSSWCKLGLNEADFGFGKPSWIVPTDASPPPSLRNSILFTDYSDSSGDGIEVWLFLEETEMQFLESSQGFLDFASPNY